MLAIAIYREAANQDYIGKLAVGWSIRNRVMKPGATWWGDDWETVILKPWQYSSFNANDPNAVKIPGDPANDQAWASSLLAAQVAYTGTGTDPVDSATHYYNPKAVKGTPAWVATAKFVKTIGDHWFYIAA